MNPLVELVNPLDRPRPLGLESWLDNRLTILAEMVYEGDLVLSHLKGEHIGAKDKQQEAEDYDVDDFLHDKFIFSLWLEL